MIINEVTIRLNKSKGVSYEQKENHIVDFGYDRGHSLCVYTHLL